MQHMQLISLMALVILVYVLIRGIWKDFPPTKPNKNVFKRMADEYTEFGNFTKLSGSRSNDVDYLIDMWLKLKQPEEPRPPIVVELDVNTPEPQEAVHALPSGD